VRAAGQVTRTPFTVATLVNYLCDLMRGPAYDNRKEHNMRDLRDTLSGIVELRQSDIKDYTERIERGLITPEVAQSHIEWAKGRIETANKYLQLFG
jgi:hypothetical protein